MQLPPVRCDKCGKQLLDQDYELKEGDVCDYCEKVFCEHCIRKHRHKEH